MKIDVIPKFVEIKTDNYPIKYQLLKGIRYCFIYYNGIPNISQPYENYYDWMNSFTIYFSEEELENFRINDTVHNYLLILQQESIKTIDHLEKYKKSKYCRKNEFDGINEKIDFFIENNIVFLKINFT